MQTAQYGHGHEGFNGKLQVLNRIAGQVQLDNLCEAWQVVWQFPDFIVAEVDLSCRVKQTENEKMVDFLYLTLTKQLKSTTYLFQFSEAAQKINRMRIKVLDWLIGEVHLVHEWIPRYQLLKQT